ncbi:hypothetical protein FIV00_03205 [Labrenzia sp. THAF82]|nr:hypothetical protein FIV00_03205 [Labrenzia sp. THAF82]
MKKIVVVATCIALSLPTIAVAAVDNDKDEQSHMGYTSEYSKTLTYRR